MGHYSHYADVPPYATYEHQTSMVNFQQNYEQQQQQQAGGQYEATSYRANYEQYYAAGEVASGDQLAGVQNSAPAASNAAASYYGFNQDIFPYQLQLYHNQAHSQAQHGLGQPQQAQQPQQPQQPQQHAHGHLHAHSHLQQAHQQQELLGVDQQQQHADAFAPDASASGGLHSTSQSSSCASSSISSSAAAAAAAPNVASEPSGDDDDDEPSAAELGGASQPVVSSSGVQKPLVQRSQQAAGARGLARQPAPRSSQRRSQPAAQTPSAPRHSVGRASSSGRCVAGQRKSTLASTSKSNRSALIKSATYKDTDIEHTSSYIVVSDSQSGRQVQLTNEELTGFSVPQLNKIVSGFPKQTVFKMKLRRRTLKNRGYAQSCRQKRLEEKNKLKQQNEQLLEENFRQQQIISELREKLRKQGCELAALSQQIDVSARCAKQSVRHVFID